jgi:hypothetical protein
MSHYIPPSPAAIADNGFRAVAHRQWIADMTAGADAAAAGWREFGLEQQKRSADIEALRQLARQQAEQARQQAADDAEQRRHNSAAMARLVGLDSSASIVALRSELSALMTEIGL